MSEPMIRRTDPVERAHLRDAQGFSPPVHRFVPSPEVSEVIRRYWVPVWDLPPGRVSVQRVLAYPVCHVVVADDYARLVGPSSGLSTRELSGHGWAVGAMLQPGAGAAVLGASVSGVTDGFVDLAGLPGLDGVRLAAGVTEAMRAGPAREESQLRAVAALEAELRRLPPPDEEGRLINAVVEYVEGDPSVRRVAQVVEKFALSERSLQRLCARRIGLSPKWLIQRRRLHEAAARLTTFEPPDLARVAADLGYADQAHFTRDFRTVTGLTPGEFAAEPR